MPLFPAPPTVGISRASSQLDKTSNTTLSAIPGLSATLPVGTYSFVTTLHITCGATGGWKVDLAGGSLTISAAVVQYNYTNNDGTSMTPGVRYTSLASTPLVTGNTIYCIVARGLFTVSAAGTLIPRFAQAVSNGTTSSVLVGSTMRVEKVA